MTLELPPDDGAPMSGVPPRSPVAATPRPLRSLKARGRALDRDALRLRGGRHAALGWPIDPPAPARPGRTTAALLDLVFLLGLAGVFLANAAVAVVEPQGFTDLVAGSVLGGLIGDATWVAPLISANDFVIGTAVIAAHRFQRLRLPVLAWAGTWLMIVTLIKATTMG